MKKLLLTIDRDGERWLLLVLYIYIVAVIFVEVVRRFVLDFSSIWGEETARYAFIYLVWIGAAAAVRDRAHIRIDVLLPFLPPRARTAIFLLGDVLMGVLATVILYLSIGPFLGSLQYGSVIEGLRVLRHVLWQKFEGHVTTETRVLGFVHHAHATAANFANNRVVGDCQTN